MLDWDKPLEQQPTIRDLLKGTDYEVGLSAKEAEKIADERLRQEAYDWADETGGDPVDYMNNANWEKYVDDVMSESGKVHGSITGEELHKMIMRDQGYRKELFDPYNYQVDTSETLRELGIPGIKYLDRASRGAGEGTRNFVVFPGEEEAVKILERRKDGGAVMMANGGSTLREMGQPRYSTERKGTNAFKFTKDVLENLYQMAKMQAAEELKTTDPRAITDVANNIIADTVGAPVDMVNMALQSFGVGSERPIGGSQQMRDLMREYEMTSGVERPLTETLLSIAGPGAVAKGPRAAERALNVGTAAVRRPFTPVTVTTEAVAPDLAKTQDEAFKQYVTKQLLGEGDVKTLGGRPVTQRPGQGVYYNEAGQLELNPMVGLDVPVRGSLAKAEKFKGDVATLGAGLGQEAMAAHRFIPMATNQIKDATAMLIKGPEGKPLTREQVIELGQDLPNMIVTHSPRLGGVMVAPFSITKGVIPPEFLEA